MVLPIIPGYFGMAVTAFQLLLVLISYKKETTAGKEIPYSKFAHKESSTPTPHPSAVARKKKTDEDDKDAAAVSSSSEPDRVSSKVAMMIIYAPALVSCLTFHLLFSPEVMRFQPSYASGMMTLHFCKRVAEVQYLHKYSGTVPLEISVQLGTAYLLICYLIFSVASASPPDWTIGVGTVLFAVGELGNFFHHYLLAALRKSPAEQDKSDTSTKYVAPRGGLFEYVAAPHYLFELLAWLGMAIVSDQVNVYLVFLGMTSYLSGRAVAQNQWNRRKFGADGSWPSTRKNLIPFIF